MNLYQKISVLGPSARYDTCGPKDFDSTTNVPGVYHAKVNGGVCRLFKVLQTNSCKNNCHYCAFRKDRSCQRTSTTPDEMAKAFDLVYRKRLVDGLFLSSALTKSADFTMEQTLKTSLILRQKFNYRGYLHLKLMPQTSLGCLKTALSIANRVSLNIESPTPDSLNSLSPEKDLNKDLLFIFSQINQEIKKLKYQGQKTPSLTTQFVVGAGQENDFEFIKSAHFLYKSFHLKRIFYSAFRPVEDTPLSQKEPTSPLREHRLYQADFLMRFYKFSPWDIPLDKNGFLDDVSDPKTAWAKKHPRYYPINLNKASFYQLLKIPGIGPTSAKKIVQLRKMNKIKSFSQLTKQRFQIKKLTPYVSL